MKIFASDTDHLVAVFTKIAAAWLGVIGGMTINEWIGAAAGLSAFVYSSLNVYFLLQDRWGKKSEDE